MTAQSRLLLVATLYCASQATMLVGGLLGGAFLQIGEAPSLKRLFVVYDSAHYADIATNGYDFDPSRRSNVAFFPGYPLLGRMVSRALSVPIEFALVLVSHVSFLLAMWLMTFQPSTGGADQADSRESTRIPWVLFAVAFYAPGIFFRAAYSEALFTACVAGTLVAFQQRRTFLAAGIAGLAAGIRPVGIGLLPACCAAAIGNGRTPRCKIGGALAAALLSSWGLMVYMWYLGMTFGAPLAFAQTQQHWSFRGYSLLSEELAALLTAEPIWSVYVPSCACYWRRLKSLPPAINVCFQNPMVYLAAVGLVIFGWRRRIIDPIAALTAAGLLAIPYVTRSYHWCMNSHARFTAVAVPLFFVIGELLRRMPSGLRWVVATGYAGWLMLYAAAMVAGAPLF